MEKKLQKLDRKTQKAIYEIIRMRLEKDDNVNLAEAVANAETQQNFLEEA